MVDSDAITRRPLLALPIMLLTVSFRIFAQRSETRPIHVYIFTAAPEGGFVDAQSKARTDSLEDVRKAFLKKKFITLVDSQERAEITFEIVSRDTVPDGKTSFFKDPLFGTMKSSADTVPTLYTVLTVGTYSTGIVGRNDGRITNVWAAAANNAVDQVDKWIKDNAARIPRK